MQWYDTNSVDKMFFHFIDHHLYRTQELTFKISLFYYKMNLLVDLIINLNKEMFKLY